MDRNYRKPKFRAGLAIGIEELKESEAKARDLMSELLMEPGYIGHIDAEYPKLRVYVFKDGKSREKMLRVAKDLGFRTAGSIQDAVYVSNEILSRPHMKYVSKENFYKELYK